MGRPLLEVLVCKKYTSDSWVLPGAVNTAAPGTKMTEVNPLVRKVFGIDNPEYLEMNDILKDIEITLLEKSKVIYKGCTMDVRDTDNAWIESEIFHFHDEFDILGSLELRNTTDDLEAVTWAVAHSQLELSANHLTILEIIC